MKKIFIFLFLFCATLFAAELNTLHKEISSALKSGKKEITLKNNQYRISKPLSLSNLKDVTIDGSGAKITVTRAVAAANIINSSNISLKNLILTYDPLPFTQGFITEVDKKEKSAVLEIDKGYPGANKTAWSWNCKSNLGSKDLPYRRLPALGGLFSCDGINRHNDT